jgi:ATP-dependent exoDNAse (exonuclease V) alpha subunit
LTGKVNTRPHAVELAFAITYEKIQGKTMKKIILDLNSAPTRPIHYDAFYTGISRVRRSCDLKIIPIPPSLTLQHLKKLKPDKKLIYWQKRNSRKNIEMEQNNSRKI